MPDDKCRRFTDTEAETMLMTMFLLARRARFTVTPCKPDASEFEFGLRHAQAFDAKLRLQV